MTNDPVLRKEGVLEPVTKEVTTAPGDDRRSATYPDADVFVNCGYQT
jgi:hypothetical protein